MAMVSSTKSVSRSAPNGRVRRNAGLKHLSRANPAPKHESTVFLGRGASYSPDLRPSNDTDNIGADTLKHGRYETVDTIFRANPFEADITPRVVNRAVTVIDDWIDGDAFAGRHVRIIEECRELWRDIKRPRHPHFDPRDPDEQDDSFESERAKSLLHRCRRLVGNHRWNIFENVIRWNEPTGVPGSRIANVRPPSILAAQAVVRGVADEIGCAWIL